MRSYYIPALTSELRSVSKNSAPTEVDRRPGLAASELDGEQLQLYRIEVRTQGHLVAEHIIAARDAQKAITLIENEYGGPVQAELVVIETGDGRRRRVMVAKDWHGYTFEARVIDP